MSFFKKKPDHFVSNVTRSALGEGYFVPSAVESRRQSPHDLGNPVAAIRDEDLEQLPESVAAMMIYGYCTIKYQSPDMSEQEVFEQLLRSRGYDSDDIQTILTDNDDSLYHLINTNLKFENSPYTFSDKQLTTFYQNLCIKAVIFRDIDVA